MGGPPPVLIEVVPVGVETVTLFPLADFATVLVYSCPMVPVALMVGL
jgi:hypothetical protein